MNKIAFYKIDGDEQIQTIKRKIVALVATTTDLEQALSFVNFIIKNYNDLKMEKNHILLAALTSNAIVAYARCFISGFSHTLDHSLFNDTLTENSTSDQISERDFHRLIMNYRKKHIAHTDDFMKAYDVGGSYINENLALLPTYATRITIEEPDFYQTLQKLAMKALEQSKKKKQLKIDKLITLINEGKGKLTTEEMKLTPIASDITPQEMWGLHPKK